MFLGPATGIRRATPVRGRQYARHKQADGLWRPSVPKRSMGSVRGSDWAIRCLIASAILRSEQRWPHDNDPQAIR
jgi:hypothetical protein